MKNIRQPPMIHHCNQTEYIQRGASLVQMAADACAAMYLPDRMKKLLTFYADCPDGFFPALKTVRENTGMDRRTFTRHGKNWLMSDSFCTRPKKSALIGSGLQQWRCYRPKPVSVYGGVLCQSGRRWRKSSLRSGSVSR